MKALWILAVVALTPLTGCAGTDDEQTAVAELNVNSRYTVESVHVMGLRRVQISDPLRRELDKIIGSKYDDSALKRLADRIRKELHATDVKVNAVRGTEPDHLIVNFDVKAHEQPFDVNMAKFLYDTKQGWTGDGSATTHFAGNAFTFGLMSDGDSMIERFAGMRLKFQRPSLGTDRVGLRFEFDTFHEQWNEATLEAASPADIYRTRQVFTPEATILIAQPLDWSLGVSFARFRIVDGGLGAKTESANAVVSTLRYHQRWGSASTTQEKDAQGQDLTAAYSIRAGTNILGSDSSYTRHMIDARYRIRRLHNTVEIGLLAGRMTGTAPLFERFLLGDSSRLRGWNKFELDPIGGSRVVTGSIDYRYRFFTAFYDTGAVWDRGQDREAKQSAGVGLKKEPFQLAVAFPLRAGRAEPIFYAGMNF